MDNCLKQLKKEIACRDELIKQLFLLLGNPNEPIPDCLFLYGHIGSGKSLVIKSILNYLDYSFTIINCIEQQNPKQMFEYILTSLSSYELNSADSYREYKKVDNTMDFLINLKKEFPENERQPIFLVFDKCDRLRNAEGNLLPALLRLRELSGLNVCVIMISDIVFEKYQTKSGLLEPIKIFFPQYSQQETLEILMLNKPSEYEVSFYKNYLNLFLSVFYRFCRDVSELRYMAKLNFQKYVEPIENGTCKVTDITKLWHNISNVFKSNLEVIYLRVVATDFDQKNQSEFSREIESTTKLALSFELPYYAKFLLIAAFLASYNPPKEDKRIFMRNTGKTRKVSARKKIAKLKTYTAPRNFSLDRMLAIFCCINDDKVDLNANLLAQIPSMCHLGILANIGDNNLDEPKYKCCVSYDFIAVISKNVGFNIKNYLYDN